MSAREVPSEWVEAFAHAWPEPMLVRKHIVKTLCAVAPMIAAQERERCARVLEAEGHHIAAAAIRQEPGHE